MGMRSVIGAGVLGILGLVGPNAETARAEDPVDPIVAIDAEFQREMTKLEKVRLAHLAKLAASQAGAEADRSYEACFRAAIAGNLYAEAEPIADTAMKTGGLAPQVTLLAHLVKLIAQANRGAYEESLANLETAIHTKADARHGLPVEMKLSLIDAYAQKLVQGGQFVIARKALTEIGAKTKEPALKDLVERRLLHIDLVGKPAPVLDGEDIDGKPIRLADFKGDVVLVVFWATWCLPHAEELAMLDQAYTRYREKGLRIVGVNVDAFQDGGRPVESVVPDVKRYLIERNVRWPNLIERPGERDLAKAYGVTDIPSNVLIGRDGTIQHIDLTRANLERVLAKSLAK